MSRKKKANKKRPIKRKQLPTMLLLTPFDAVPLSEKNLTS